MRELTERPVRVLQVTGVMNRGGAEALIMNLYRSIDRSRVQFDFVENAQQDAYYDEEIRRLGGRIYHCPHYNGRNHFEYVRWWKLFFQEKGRVYRIIHGHIGSTASIYLNLARKNGLYTIAHSHNSGTDHSARAFLYKIYTYNTRNIGDYFFACSDAAGRDRFGKRITLSGNYRVLHNAIDTSQFRFNPSVREQIRRELDIGDAILIGHVGRFEKQKNHRLLLEIFQKVLEKRPDSMLMLVGDGTLRTEIEQISSAMSIHDRIIFTGVRSDVNKLIQAMDVLVFPSLYEGLPVTLVEAQTSGLPCVISEKVPDESILVKNLVKVCSLSEGSDLWAEQSLAGAGIERRDCSQEVAGAGYDIGETAKWLESFYLEKYGQTKEHAGGIYTGI